jgi:chemotaxis protein MotB
MKTRLKTSVVSVSVALVLFSSCVSSKKYHASQAETAKVRGDSAQLAQQVASLNTNVQDLQSKNNTLQQSLDASNSRTATTQKSLDYYQDYFKQQQSALSQASDDVKGALTTAGVANADVQQANGAVYVRLDEDELFKKNSVMMSANGKKALDGLADVIKNRQNMNVFVGGGDSTSGAMVTTGTVDNMSPSNTAAAPRPRHHRTHTAASTTGGTTGSASATASTTTPGAPASGAPVKKKVHHHYSSEGGMVYNSRMGSRSQALKRARMAGIADHFLKSGMSKVNITLQQANLSKTSDDKTIRVILTPKMEDFNPTTSASR